jgi:hypothetical protein
MPALARRNPALRRSLVAGVFLSPTTALTDLALLGVVIGVWRRHPGALLLAVPWLVWRWPEVAGRRTSFAALRRAGALAIADVISSASLLEGSLRHRRLVL